MDKPKKTPPSRQPKKRATKYEKPVAVNASFMDIVKVMTKTVKKG